MGVRQVYLFIGYIDGKMKLMYAKYLRIDQNVYKNLMEIRNNHILFVHSFSSSSALE